MVKCAHHVKDSPPHDPHPASGLASTLACVCLCTDFCARPYATSRNCDKILTKLSYYNVHNINHNTKNINSNTGLYLKQITNQNACKWEWHLEQKSQQLALPFLSPLSPQNVQNMSS